MSLIASWLSNGPFSKTLRRPISLLKYRFALVEHSFHVCLITRFLCPWCHWSDAMQAYNKITRKINDTNESQLNWYVMKYSTIKSIFLNAFQYFLSLVSIHYCNKFFIFHIRDSFSFNFTSGTFRTVHFIYRTLKSRNNDCRKHDSSRTHLRGRKVSLGWRVFVSSKSGAIWMYMR